MQSYLLVFQDEFQRDILCEFGGMTVCINNTHGTIDFEFNSALVFRDFFKGLPVRWAICNREDITIMEILKAVMDRTGPLTPN